MTGNWLLVPDTISQWLSWPPPDQPKRSRPQHNCRSSAIHRDSEIFKAGNVKHTDDKGLLYGLLQALLSVKQEKEIQMKMIMTRGESVLQNTSPEGIPAIQQQLASVKDMWASLLSAAIRCKRLVKLKGYCQVIAERSIEWLSNTLSRVSPSSLCVSFFLSIVLLPCFLPPPFLHSLLPFFSYFFLEEKKVPGATLHLRWPTVLCLCFYVIITTCFFRLVFTA